MNNTKTILLGVLFILLNVTNTNAHSNVYTENVDVAQGCIEGECINGWGIYIFPNGSKYIGYFKNSNRHGYGYYVFQNGDEYIGDWKNNRKHGNGTYKYSEKGLYSRYVGEWNEDKREGIGLIIFQNDSRKFGKWTNDEFVEEHNNVGCSIGDCYSGYGVYVWTDGSLYKGQYQYGKRNGEGKYYYPKGGKYIGSQKNGMRDGFGTYFYPSGNRFVGEWDSETKHGEGILFAEGEIKQQGVWENNKFTKSQPVRKEILEYAGINTYLNHQASVRDVSPPVITITKPDVTRGPRLVVKQETITVAGTVTDDSGIDRIRINGKVATISASGTTTKGFAAKIDLAAGQNTFWVEATDVKGNTIKEDFTIIYDKASDNGNVVATKPKYQKEKTNFDVSEKRTALIIGNSTYPVSPLRNPMNDARAMAEKLTALGFEVILETNADKKGMVTTIRDFGMKLKENGGVGLFYYAGHGIQVSGENYLIPVDSDVKKELDIELESVRLQRVLNELDYAGNRLNIVVLDACRDNPFTGLRSVNNGLAPVSSAPIGTFIAYATSPGESASDGSGSHGLYTQSLLNILDNAQGLTLEEVFKRVRTEVRKQSDGTQIPWENSAIEGDFYFIKR